MAAPVAMRPDRLADLRPVASPGERLGGSAAGGIRTLLLPLVLPFILSLMPLFILQVDVARREGFAREGAICRGHPTAAGLVVETRATTRFSDQIDRMSRFLRTDLEEILFHRPPGNQVLTAAMVDEGWRRRVPATHRPPGSLIWSFAMDGGSGKLVALTGRDGRANRMVTEVLGLLANPSTLAPADRETANRRLRGIFGPALDIDSMSEDHCGQPTPGFYQGRRVWILWDRVKVRKRTVGVILQLFPFPVGRSVQFLRHGLEQTFSPRSGFRPLLVPMRTARASARPLDLLHRWPVDRTWGNRLRALIPPARRESVLPLGLPSEIAPGWLCLREQVGDHLPYELWLIGRLAPGRRPVTAALLWLGLLLHGTVWTAVLFRMWLFGQPLHLTMRSWVLVCFLLLAANPLLALYSVGMFQIETSAARQRQAAVDGAMRCLREADESVATVYAKVARTARRLLQDHPWARSLLLGTPPARTKAADRAFRHFLRSHLPLDLLLVFRRWEAPEICVPSGRPTARDQAALDFQAPIILGGNRILDPSFPWIASRTQAIIGLELDQKTYFNFLRWRQKAYVMQLGNNTMLQIHETVSSRDRVVGTILFRTQAESLNETHLRTALATLGFEERGTRFFLGRRQGGGMEPLVPNPGPDWHSGYGPGLRKIMEMACRSNGPQLVESAQHAFLAHPCRQAVGYVLGASLTMRPFIEEADRWHGILLTVTVLLLFPVFLLSRFLANHLLNPLRQVEQGLRKVTRGDLQPVLGETRNDELGDLTRSFEEMLAGLRERQFLGRFVSGTLEAEMIVDGAVPDTRAPLPRASAYGGVSGGPLSRSAAVLFSDLRGFTTLAEQHPPTVVMEMLNHHHHTMVEVISRHGGQVECFVGDAVAAIFSGATSAGGEEETIRQASRAALGCAEGMMAAHRRIQEERRAQLRFTYGMGVGIASGIIQAGTLTTEERLEFTVLGAPRQAAEALEALSKRGQYSRIVVSPEVASSCPERGFHSIEQGVLELVGPEGGDGR